MATDQTPDPLDPATIERLLTGESVAGHESLYHLLTSVRAPGTGEELVGEYRAVLAFRDFGSGCSRKHGTGFKDGLARFLTIKAATLVVVVGVGGVAIAANTGHLPDSIGPAPQGATTAAQHHPVPSTPPRPSQRQSPVPDPSRLDHLSRLCTRYSANDRNSRRAALEHESEFRDLINSVGELDQAKIDRFCEEIRNPQAPGIPRWNHNNEGPRFSVSVMPSPDGLWMKRSGQHDFPPTVPGQKPNSAPSGRPDHDPPAR